MSELPDRPDLDQLRRQAKELLHAAAAGDPVARARLQAVSDRVTLSAAQLAVAREHGHASWPALRAEAQRRRQMSEAARPPAEGGYGRPSPDAAADRWSFAGGTPLQVAAGALSPGGLAVGPAHAVLDASLMPSAETERRLAGPGWARVPGLPFIAGLFGRSTVPAGPEISFDDVAVTDERGDAHTLAFESGTILRAVPGRVRGPIELRLRLDPVPARGCGWLELRSQDGAATRLLPSARATVRVSQPAPAGHTPAEWELTEQARSLIALQLGGIGHDAQGREVLAQQCSRVLDQVAELRQSGELDSASELPGQLARLCAALTGQHPGEGLPAAWSGMLAAAQRADGLSQHLDIAAALQPLEGITVQLDSLISEPGGWRIYLRARPRWWASSENPRRRWTPVLVHAQDDRGGSYVTIFGGGTADRDGEEFALQFLPRLDPIAQALTLTFSSPSQQTAVDLDLIPAAQPEKEWSR